MQWIPRTNSANPHPPNPITWYRPIFSFSRLRRFPFTHFSPSIRFEWRTWALSWACDKSFPTPSGKHPTSLFFSHLFFFLSLGPLAFYDEQKYLKHSSPEVFGLLNENIFHLSFSDIKFSHHFVLFKLREELGWLKKIGEMHCCPTLGGLAPSRCPVISFIDSFLDKSDSYLVWKYSIYHFHLICNLILLKIFSEYYE